MHRNKDAAPGEDGHANRLGNATRDVFPLAGFALKIPKSIPPSPARAIEHLKDDRNRAIRVFSGFHGIALR